MYPKIDRLLDQLTDLHQAHEDLLHHLENDLLSYIPRIRNRMQVIADAKQQIGMRAVGRWQKTNARIDGSSDNDIGLSDTCREVANKLDQYATDLNHVGMIRNALKQLAEPDTSLGPENKNSQDSSECAVIQEPDVSDSAAESGPSHDGHEIAEDECLIQSFESTTETSMDGRNRKRRSSSASTLFPCKNKRLVYSVDCDGDEIIQLVHEDSDCLSGFHPDCDSTVDASDNSTVQGDEDENDSNHELAAHDASDGSSHE